jgi:hypothetical protein
LNSIRKADDKALFKEFITNYYEPIISQADTAFFSEVRPPSPEKKPTAYDLQFKRTLKLAENKKPNISRENRSLSQFSKSFK